MTPTMPMDSEDRSFLEERRFGRELMFHDDESALDDRASDLPEATSGPPTPAAEEQAPLPTRSSQKAWSPIPIDVGALMDKERMAALSRLEAAPPDAETPFAGTAPPAPAAPRLPGSPAAHPSAIQTHLTSHASFITSDRQIGLKLLGRPVEVAAPGVVADHTVTPLGVEPQPLRTNARSDAPATHTLATQLATPALPRTTVHPESAATMPTMPAVPAVPITPIAPVQLSRASVHESRTEARDTGIIWVPAIGVAQVIDHDPQAGRGDPTPIDSIHSQAVFEDAPSGDPTDTGDAPAMIRTRVQRNLDWRVGALGALLLGYLPLLGRQVVRLHPADVTGFGVLAVLMSPVVFVVAAARRPPGRTPTRRRIDLVLGTLLTLAALLAGRAAPGVAGAGAALWRPDLLAVPVAVAAAFVLLWGTRFAADLRNVVFATALGAPLLSLWLLLTSGVMFSGSVNPLAETLAGTFTTVVHTATRGVYAVGATDPVTLDLRPVIERRSAVVAVGMVALVLLMISRVDPTGSSADTVGPIGRRVRKLAAFVLTLSTAVLADVLVGAVALAGPQYLPGATVTVLTSLPVAIVLAAVAAWSVTRWVHLLGLYIPSLSGILHAPMSLPPDGPTGQLDRIVSGAAVGALAISALLSGIDTTGPLQGASAVKTSSRHITTLRPAGWSVQGSDRPDVLHTEFGAAGRWTRVSLAQSNASPLAQIAIDVIEGNRSLLTRYPIASTYRLGGFRRLRSRVVDLGPGASGHQDTFYDAETASTWSTVTFLAVHGTVTTRVTMSATGSTDTGVAPVPAMELLASLVDRRAGAVTGDDRELARGRIDRTEGALAELARAEVEAILGAPAVPGPTA